MDLISWIIDSMIAASSIGAGVYIGEKGVKAMNTTTSPVPVNRKTSVGARANSILITGCLIFTPYLQLATPFLMFIFTGIFLLSFRSEFNEALDKYTNKQNILYECMACRKVVRCYQRPSGHKCCERYMYSLDRQIDANVYEFALETGLTPLLSTKKARAMFKAEIKSQQEQAIEMLAERQREEEQKKMKKELKKQTKKAQFIERQTGIVVKEQMEQLENLRQEIEKRQEVVASTLGQEEATKLQGLLRQFDAIYQAQLENTQQFEEKSKQQLAEVEEKMKYIS